MERDLEFLGYPGYVVTINGMLINPHGRIIGGNANGYVKLGKEFWSIPKLVALAFNGPKPGYDYIRYIDGDRWNWHAGNLEWCVTPQVSTPLQAQVLAAIQSGRKPKDIAEDFGITANRVRSIAHSRQQELRAREAVEAELRRMED